MIMCNRTIPDFYSNNLLLKLFSKHARNWIIDFLVLKSVNPYIFTLTASFGIFAILENQSQILILIIFWEGWE